MKNRKYTIASLVNNFLVLSLVGLFAACDLFRFKSDDDREDDPVVAEVDNQKLRKSDLAFVTLESGNPRDSANISNRYVQSWIRKQLIIKEAAKNMTFDEVELNRKLLDYKYTLMVYEFEKAYVEDNLEKEIDIKDVQNYYQDNKQNFSLKEIIVRTGFVKVEKGNSQIAQLERILKNQVSNSSSELREMASKYATNYFLEDSTWVRFEDIIVNTPLENHGNKVGLLQNNKVIQVEDHAFRYYFNILEYKLQDQTPPLEFVSEEISKILLNKKRIALVEKLQKDIYNRALEKNEFQLYE